MTRKSKRSEDAGRFATNMAGAEAVALGTAAGALVIGALQAHEAQQDAVPGQADATNPDTNEHAGSGQSQHADLANSSHHADQPTDSAGHSADPASGTAGFVPAAAIVQDVPPSLMQLPGNATPDAPSSSGGESPVADQVSAADAAPQPDLHAVAALPTPEHIAVSWHDELGARLADQIAHAVTDALGETLPNLNGEALTNSIASHIETATTEIVSHVADSLSAHLVPSIDGIASALPQTADIADDLLSSIADVPQQLLGHDGGSEDHGLLASVFYSDGHSEDAIAAVAHGTSPSGEAIAAESPPTLADLGSGVDSGVASLEGDVLHLGFLGTSYLDDHGADLPVSHGGINALHLL
jgi:hypothetical protein